MITMMITKDDDKGDDKKLKDQSKNNSSESRTIQEFKIRIKKNSRLKKKVQSQESRFKVQDLKNQDQDSRLKIQESREGLIKISIKSFSQKLSST